MITFTSIASGSSGNCYIIRSSSHSALIELGIPWKKILPAINFKASELDFAAVTHPHGDHSKSVKDALKAGVDVYLSSPTAEALGVSGHHRIHILEAGKQQTIESWTVLPFDLAHDVPTLGFVISDGEDKLLFIPDTEYINNRFEGITILVIEANHNEDLLSQNIVNGTIPGEVGRRVRRTHLSIEVVKDFIRANNFSRLKEAHLIHLSDSNSNEAAMKKDMQELLGIPIYVA
jgi:phosphoribosyl 1,2-cyclic phosphodiesterase